MEWGGGHILDLIIKLSKQTLKCTYTIINKYKFLIHIMDFISFLNKQVILPHSVSLFQIKKLKPLVVVTREVNLYLC